MVNFPENAILLVDSRHGIYVPQSFAKSIKRECVTNVTPEQWSILEQGPSNESLADIYWDVWYEVENKAIIAEPSTGAIYKLYQDGDLWLVPEDWQLSDY